MLLCYGFQSQLAAIAQQKDFVSQYCIGCKYAKHSFILLLAFLLPVVISHWKLFHSRPKIRRCHAKIYKCVLLKFIAFLLAWIFDWPQSYQESEVSKFRCNMHEGLPSVEMNDHACIIEINIIILGKSY